MSVKNSSDTIVHVLYNYHRRWVWEETGEKNVLGITRVCETGRQEKQPVRNFPVSTAHRLTFGWLRQGRRVRWKTFCGCNS